MAFYQGDNRLLVSPDGTLYPVVPENVDGLLRDDWRDATPDDITLDEDKQWAGDSEFLAAGAGAARGATFGASDYLLTKAGAITPQRLGQLEEQNPVISGVSELGGTVIPSLFSGGTAGAVGAAGKVATKAASKSLLKNVLGKTAAAIGKAPSGIVARATEQVAGKGLAAKIGAYSAEGALYGAGELLSETSMGNAEWNAENALAYIGLGGVLGGGVAGGGHLLGLGAKATVRGGKKVFKDTFSNWEYKDQVKALSGGYLKGSRALGVLKDQPAKYSKAEIAILEQKGVEQTDLLTKFLDETELLKVTNSTEDMLKLIEKTNKETGEKIAAHIEAFEEIILQDTKIAVKAKEGLAGDAFQEYHNNLTISNTVPWKNKRSNYPDLTDAQFKAQSIQTWKVKQKLVENISKNFERVESFAPRHYNIDADGNFKFGIRKDEILFRIDSHIAHMDTMNVDGINNMLTVRRRLSDKMEGVAPNENMLTMQEAVDLRRDLGNLLYADKELAGFQGVPTSKEGLEATRKILRSELKSAASHFDEFNADGAYDLGQNFLVNNDRYWAGSAINDTLGEIIERDNRNRTFSLTDVLHGGSGMLGGVALGAVSDDISITQGAMLGLGAKLVGSGASKLLRERGAQASSQLLRKIRQNKGSPEAFKSLAKASLLTHAAIKTSVEAISTPDKKKKKKEDYKPDYRSSFLNTGYDGKAEPDEAKQINKHQAKFDSYKDNPTQIVEELDASTPGLKASAPDTHMALVVKTMKAIEFLNEKIPKPPEDIGALHIGYKWKPTPGEILTYARYVAAVENPLSVLDSLNGDKLNLEGVEALKVVYPEIYEEIKTELLVQVEDLRDSVPYNKRVQLSLMFDVPVDYFMADDKIVILHALNTRDNKEQEKQQGTKLKSKPSPTEVGRLENKGA